MEVALIVLRATVALAAALFGAYACRHRSAALRHFVLAAGLGVAALAVPFARVMPAWEVLPPAAIGDYAVVPTATSPTAARIDSAVEARAARPVRSAWPPVRVVAVVVWLGGVAMVGAPVLLGLIGLRRWSARATAVSDTRWLELRDAVAAQVGVTREVRLVHGDGPVGTWGFLRPRIMLPSDTGGWAEDCRRAVLAHELAHVRRGDWAVQLAAETVRALFWFNPLAWAVAGKLRAESERACDDIVLDTGMDDATYAAHLLDIARATRGATPAAAMAMARPSTLEGRIAAMLNPSIDRRLPSRASRAVVVVLLTVVASVAAVRVIAQVAGPAALQGVVYDSSGAVLPAVEMALTNEQGIKWSTPTDGEGRFEFAPVGAGKYVLEASIPGLRTLHQDIVLERTKDWTRLITMQVGELQEMVQVVARRPRAAAPAARSNGGPVRVGGNIKPPRKIVDVRPTYPEAMRAADLEGVVNLDVLIATDGTVASVRVLNSEAHPDFGAAASDAVRQWKFTPTLLNGKPVEVAMTASVQFSLSDN